jgi:DNA-binding transcriptional ArsR family regulator
MLEQSAATQRVFHALADGTRRELIERLSRGPASVSELARPLPMSLAAVVQHVQVLEESGIVRTRKEGRVRTCELDPGGLLEAERWIARRRALWEGRLDRLGALLEVHVAPGQIDGSTDARSTRGSRRGRGERQHQPKRGRRT